MGCKLKLRWSLGGQFGWVSLAKRVPDANPAKSPLSSTCLVFVSVTPFKRLRDTLYRPLLNINPQEWFSLVGQLGGHLDFSSVRGCEDKWRIELTHAYFCSGG